MKKEKILVTGGAGFVGSHLVRSLESRDYEVWVVDDLSFGHKEYLSEHVVFVKNDIRKLENTTKALTKEKFSYVFHLAAHHFIPYCNRNPKETFDVNVYGTYQVLKFVEEVKPKKVFFASTAAVYPISNRKHCETDFPSPGDVYGYSKYLCEQMIESFHFKTSIPCVIGRFFNAFGKNETNPHLIPSIYDQLIKGKTKIQLGNLEPKRDFIHTEDMCDAIVKLMFKLNKKFVLTNIGSGCEYSVLDVVKAFEKALNKKITIDSIKSLQRKNERMHLCADTTLLKELIQFEPSINLEKGIALMFR